MEEMLKLENWLKKNAEAFGWSYVRECKKGIIEEMDRNFIIVKDEKGEYLWDAAFHFASYGYSEGLLEIAGTLVDEEEAGDTVEGSLSADDIIAKIYFKHGLKGDTMDIAKFLLSLGAKEYQRRCEEAASKETEEPEEAEIEA